MGLNSKILKVESSAKALPKPKDVIVDPMGQYKYPGQITKIPSNKITMKGISYPVLGIDDLGNEIMMLPDNDYIFPGTEVTEYPQMKNGGGWLDKYQEGGEKEYKGSSISLEDVIYNTPNMKPVTYAKEKMEQEDNPKLYNKKPTNDYFKLNQERQDNTYIPIRDNQGNLLNPNNLNINEKVLPVNTELYENIAEFFDPTGALSYDDVSTAYNNPNASKTDVALEVLGALPIIGKIGKGIDLYKGLNKSRKVINNIDKVISPITNVENVLNKIPDKGFSNMISEITGGLMEIPASKNAFKRQITNTGIDLTNLANRGAGTQQLKAKEQGGEIDYETARGILEAGSAYGQPLTYRAIEHFMSITGATEDEDGGYIFPDEESVSNDEEMPSEEDDYYRRGGNVGLRRFTDKNIKSSINELFQRNETLFGERGRRYYKTKLEQGGNWLDKYNQ